MASGPRAQRLKVLIDAKSASARKTPGLTPLALARAVSAGLLLGFIGSAPAVTAAGPQFATPHETARPNAPSATAQVEPLRQALASGESATAVLDRWFRDHGLAPPGSVRAEKLRPDSFPIPREAGAKLGLNGRAIGKRRVRLHCAGTQLSEARLWYVPNLLTPAMRRKLARTSMPFGSVVAPLRFRRVQSRIANLSNLGGFIGPGAGDLLSVEAFLVLPDGRPFAFTQEVYKSSLLRGPRPSQPSGKPPPHYPCSQRLPAIVLSPSSSVATACSTDKSRSLDKR